MEGLEELEEEGKMRKRMSVGGSCRLPKGRRGPGHSQQGTKWDDLGCTEEKNTKENRAELIANEHWVID